MSKATGTVSPDVAMMAALIEQYAAGTDHMDRRWRCTPGSAIKAAEALSACGYRRAATDTDQQQNAALARLETAVTRLEGWAGLPRG